MRKLLMSGLAIVSLAGAAAAADVLAQLGVSPASAKEAAVSGVTSGYFNYMQASRAFKAASPAVRVAMVQGAVAWARTYTATPEFKAAYEKVREQQKPTPPQFTGTPEDEYNAQQAKQKAEQAKNLEDMKKAMASMTPEQRKMIEEGQKAAAAVQAQMNTPEMRQMMLKGIAMDRESKKDAYARDFKKWQQDYPENPNLAVARRLQQFLDETKDVDFGAVLQGSGKRQSFVNPAYEGKSENWKVAFRAGKEPVTAARTAVKAWLDALPK